jgi:selenium-binding protein 1
MYPLPGRMLITGLSNATDHGGKTGMVEYSNEGKYIQTMWMPQGAEYGYDVRVQPHLNRMLTSSFTGWNNYMMDFGQMLADKEAMKRFGSTMVIWDFHARKPLQTFVVPGAPLEIRWALQPRHYYAFTATALTSKIWLISQNSDGTFAAKAVGDIGDPAKVPLPVDISLSADDQTLFVNTFLDGFCRVYNVANPTKPKLIHEQKIGAQVNMVSQTWDGKRVYFTSSLLANWDKKGEANEQFLKAYTWDGKKLTPAFAVDFNKENLGRPHIMHFGQDQFYKNQIFTEKKPGDETVVADAH